MNQKKKTYPTDYKRITAKLVDGSVLVGKINISPQKRLSDFINSTEKGFIILIESSSFEVTDKTVFINKNKVSWVEPE